jgi:hypothetical protein
MEDEDKAETAFESFVEKCPDSVYYTVAVSYTNTKQDGDAAATTEEGDTVSPDDGIASPEDTGDNNVNEPDTLNE